MTATDTADPTTAPDTWTQQIAELQLRYPKVREPILAALLALTLNPGAELDDAKTLAAEHGVRITAASVAAARRLLSRQDEARGPAARTEKLARTPRPGRPLRKTDPTLDPETLVRGIVEKLRAQRNAEADRLRQGIRRAIAVLEAAVGERAPAMRR